MSIVPDYDAWGTDDERFRGTSVHTITVHPPKKTRPVGFAPWPKKKSRRKKRKGKGKR